MHSEEFVISVTKKRRLGEILKAGRYDTINQLVAEGVEKRRLTTQDLRPGERKFVVLWGDDDAVSSQDVLNEAGLRKLARPTYGDAFLFGEQHPDEQRKATLVFLHDPQYLWSGHSFDLVLRADRGRRVVSLVSSGGWWHNGHRFVFVERQPTKRI